MGNTFLQLGLANSKGGKLIVRQEGLVGTRESRGLHAPVQTPLQTVVPVWNVDSVLSISFLQEKPDILMQMFQPLSVSHEFTFLDLEWTKQNLSVGPKGQGEKTPIRTECCVEKFAVRRAETFLPDTQPG